MDLYRRCCPICIYQSCKISRDILQYEYIWLRLFAYNHYRTYSVTFMQI